MNEGQEGKSWTDKGQLVEYESGVMDGLYLALSCTIQKEIQSIVSGGCDPEAGQECQSQNLVLDKVHGPQWFVNFDGIITTKKINNQSIQLLE